MHSWSLSTKKLKKNKNIFLFAVVVQPTLILWNRFLPDRSKIALF